MNTEALPSLMMFFVTLLAAILASSSTNAITPPTPIITRSSSVERISHCRAQGVMGGNNAPVLMNTWFRLDVLPASVSGTNRTWLQVRGFAFMEPVDSYALHHAQLHQADGLRHFKNQFHLYSRYTHMRYDVGRVIRGIYAAPASIHDIIELLPLDAAILEFEVVAGSIQWFCPVLGPSHQARPLPRALASYPATSKPPPSTTSPPPSTGFTPSKTGGAHGPVTAPRPQNVPHLSTWWPPLTPDSPLEGVKVFVVVSGPYSRPGHMPDVGAYVSLLCWHMRWHAALGVHQYLMYVQELATPLAQDPRVQRLVQEGALRLLLWDDTPMRDKGDMATDPYQNQFLHYNHGLLLAQPEPGDPGHTHSITLFCDLDEFLVTPKPTTIPQAFVDCASEDGTSKVPVGVMTIDRHDAVLPQRIKKKQEELSMWSYGAGVQYGAHSSMADEGGEAAGDESLSSEEDTQGDQEEQTEVPGKRKPTAKGMMRHLARDTGTPSTARTTPRTGRATARGALPIEEALQGDFPWADHPLSGYKVVTGRSERSTMHKSMALNVYARALFVHTGQTFGTDEAAHYREKAEGRVADVGGKCVRWLHLTNLFRPRLEPKRVTLEDEVVGEQSWGWPLKQQ